MTAVTGDFKELQELANKFERLPSVRIELARSLAEEYANFMKDCFQESHGPYGETWEPLKFRTSANGAAQKPLLDTGIMHNAIHPASIREDGFEVVVPQAYATTHQHGATIVPKNAKVLCFPGPVSYSRSQSGRVTRRTSGKIFAKKVVIPARPFAMDKGIPPELDTLFNEAANEFLKDFFDD